MLFALTAAATAQQSNFVGTQIGISTLSADGRSIISAGSTAVSLYKPENSITGQVFAGRHFTDWVSAQGTYGWNGNDAVLTSVHIPGGAVETPLNTRTHTIVGELMVYFRSRDSFLRPYLSAGPGVSRFSSRLRGGFARSPQDLHLNSHSTNLSFRVAVGMDVRLAKGAVLRYTFSETIQKNPISALLTPPGQRNLANFQNLFGVNWTF